MRNDNSKLFEDTIAIFVMLRDTSGFQIYTHSTLRSIIENDTISEAYEVLDCIKNTIDTTNETPEIWKNTFKQKLEEIIELIPELDG